MRSKKALLNTIAALSLELVAAICSLILPRLILVAFGSAYNGITASIGQFLTAIALLRGGIGGVTRAALYKPLAEHDSKGISEIIKSTEAFMHKVVYIFSGFFLVFALVYPFSVKDEFSWLFSFTLIIILAASTIAQNYFGFTYQLLLQSDQKYYVNSIINIVTTVLNTIVSVIFIKIGCGIHAVKLASAAVFVLQPLFLSWYVKRKYNIDKNVKANNNCIQQRWDAFAHNVAEFIHINTDVIILTLITGVRSVSVYSIFYMVLSAIKKLLNSFVTGIDAMFGNMLAKDESDVLTKSVNAFELFVFAASVLLLSVTAVLLQPFVTIYTQNVTDADYYRPVFAYLIVFAEMAYIWRLPYRAIVESSGHFKQTKKYAIIEASMNLILSVALVIKFGLSGVAIGTIVSSFYRTATYAFYIKNVVKGRTNMMFIKRVIVSAVNFAAVVAIYYLLPLSVPETYYQWAYNAVIITVISVIITLGINFIVYRKDFIYFTTKIKSALNLKRNGGARDVSCK